MKKILQYYPQIYVKVHKNGQFQKKCLHLTQKGVIIHFVVLCLDLSENYEGGAAQWQNVNFVTKKLLSASRFLTHTDVLTEHGSPT